MNDTKFLPDDPKLTAYALGELEGAERAAVEAALRDDPVARAAVAEIRALGLHLEDAFAEEATQEPAAQKNGRTAASLASAAIIPGHDPSKLDGGPRVNGRPSPLAQVIKFPQFYYVAGGLAVACFAVMVALRTPKPPLAPKVSYTTIDLSTLPTAAAEKPADAALDASDADKATDASAPAAVTVNLAPVLDATQAVPAAPSLVLSGNLSLLGQSKDLSAGKPSYVTVFNQSIPPSKVESLKNEAVGNLPRLARLEPLVIYGDATLSAVQAVESGTLNLRTPPAEGQVQLRAQRVSATQTYPADEKMLVDARAKSAAKAAPVAPTSTSPSQFEQAARQRTLLFGGASTFAANGSLTIGGASTLGANGNSAGTLASTADRFVMFNESRGLDRYAATERDATGAIFISGGSLGTDRYADVKDNDFLGAAQNRLSTFAIDVDTASYSNVRSFLRRHQRPPRDAVRIEELVNYFPYRYAPPAEAKRMVAAAAVGAAVQDSNAPFAASLEVADAPWAPEHRLVRIGLKGREVSSATRPAANLVFLLDVSGSMNAPNRLPLVKESMRLLVGKLRPDDRVAIVTYAGNSGLALASTPVSHAKEILEALDSLTPGGSTNGGMGIKLAYDIAKANFAAGGINRVILCTDGDFNVGVTSEGELTRLIDEKAKTGVALTALGFGMGNLKDATLEKLADHGNGNYGYIDSRREAEKMLVEQVNGTLVTIAKDVKIQVEFNPARVASYRLIGYENRLLKKEDFNNDAVDAGEIGAGHTVTAFYEIVPVGVEDRPGVTVPDVDELRYAPVVAAKPDAVNSKVSGELLTVKMRYKEPASETSRKLEFPLTDSGAKFVNASTDFKFAAAVASFGMILRESPHKGTATLNDVVAWAESGSTDDAGGYRAEFIDLAREAEKLEH